SDVCSSDLAPPLEGGPAHRAPAHGTANAVLYLHDVCADLRDAAARLRAGVRPEPRDASGDRLDARDPALRSPFGRDRQTEDHGDRLRRDDDLSVLLLRDAR